MKVLIWNIQRFTIKRISNATGKTDDEVLLNQQRAEAAREFILANIAAADPDVFVLLEVQAYRATTLGELATKESGAQGLFHLLGLLREKHDRNWYLVPPLKLNPGVLAQKTYTEAVGVFWRNGRVTFRGPNVWPAMPNGEPSPTGPSIPPGGGAVAAGYPGDWAAAMPAAPDANWAARVELTPGDNPKPGISDRPTNRQPYITHFEEPGGRMIRLFSVHLPPNGTAKDALARLFTIPAAVWMPSGNEVTVVAGDMNIDLSDPDASRSSLISFLKAFNGFDLVAPYPTSQAWEFTRWKTDAVSLLNKDDPDIGSFMQRRLLDYGFVRYGTPPGAPRKYQAVLAERVAGVRRVGGLEEPLREFESAMATSLNDLKDEESEKERKEQFWAYPNFGQMTAASDHLALLVEV